MEQYTIYCTEDQTRKALNLNAPIGRGHEGSRYFNIGVPTLFDENDEICRVKNSVIFIPTAEQMIGWLEEHHIDCFVGKQLNHRFVSTACVNEALIFSKPCYSRKKATLAAIDAALECLIKNKK